MAKKKKKSEVRSQKSKAGKQKSEVGGQKSEGKGPKADFTSQAAAAAYVGKDVRTIQRWKASGMGVIDLGGGRVGYTKRELDRYKKRSEGDEQNVLLKTEEIGIKGIKRQLATIELAQKRGELIPADEVRRDITEKILAARWVLLSVPNKLSLLLVGKSRARIRQILKDEMYHCLDVLAGEKVKRSQRGRG